MAKATEDTKLKPGQTGTQESKQNNPQESAAKNTGSGESSKAKDSAKTKWVEVKDPAKALAAHKAGKLVRKIRKGIGFVYIIENK